MKPFPFLPGDILMTIDAWPLFLPGSFIPIHDKESVIVLSVKDGLCWIWTTKHKMICVDERIIQANFILASER